MRRVVGPAIALIASLVILHKAYPDILREQSAQSLQLAWVIALIACPVAAVGTAVLALTDHAATLFSLVVTIVTLYGVYLIRREIWERRHATAVRDMGP